MADESPYRRAEQVADTLRRHLTLLQTGGIGVTAAVASSLAANNHVQLDWVICPISTFCAGLIIVAISLFLAKTRAIRRDKSEDPHMRFPWYVHSRPWDMFALGLFAAGVAAELYFLPTIPTP